MVENKALKKIKLDNRLIWLICFLALFGFLRIAAAHYRGPVMTVLGGYDDYLMLEYSDFSTHFSSNNIRSLFKFMGFPWFLNLPSILHISFNTLIGLYWVLAALSVWFAVRKVSNRLLASFAYVYVLFAPQGFTFGTGVRLYRNLIIAPSFYILFSVMVLLVFSYWCAGDQKEDSERSQKQYSVRILVYGLILSAVFPFVYFLKEDSFWMMPVLYLLMISEAAGLFYNFRKRIVKKRNTLILSAVVIFLPLMVFLFQSNRYLNVNEQNYGVREYTIRTNGEVAKFINSVYKIKSDNRSIQVWAPKDALEKAVSASPTLQSDPQLEDLILHSHWTAGGVNEIQGDFLSWVMMSAFEMSDNYQTPESASEFMKKVNSEIDAAFKSGILEKDNRIQITSSAGGRTWKEIYQLLPPLYHFYVSLINLDGFTARYEYPVPESDQINPYRYKLNQDIVYPDDPVQESRLKNRLDTGEKLAQADFSVYRFINPVILIAGIAGWFYCLVKWIRQRSLMDLKYRINVVLVFCLVGLGIGYTIGIIWFAQFLFPDGSIEATLDVLQFYGPGSSVLLYLPVLLSVSMFAVQLKNGLKSKRSLKTE